MTRSKDFVDEVRESPDGRLRVEWTHSDGRMSHVIRTPTVFDQRDGACLLAMSSGWDADVSWGDRPGVATLAVRNYYSPGVAGLTITVDAEARTYRVGDGEPVALADFDERFEKAYWARLETPAAQERRAPWRGKLAILAVMAGLIALTLFVSSRFW